MALVVSVNAGRLRPSEHTDTGMTGIDKLPATGPVELTAPAGRGASGVAGDRIGDSRGHGGADQAVYAYAREDLDWWQQELGRQLRSGTFGENLTTSGLAVTDALIGDRWQVGDQAVLEVSAPRIPCRTFAGWLDEQDWIKRFTARAVPGAYLRVVTPGPVQAGDELTVVHRPDHDVTVGVTFRALTLEPELLPRLLTADALPEDLKAKARKRVFAG